MGDGLVLEQGTHNELLSREGSYSHLVAAQKLRETQEAEAVDAGSDDEEDLAAAAREEIPLGRRNTGRSLASEIIEQRRLAVEGQEEEKDLGLFVLFKRMAKLMPDQWRNYAIGIIFACSTSFC